MPIEVIELYTDLVEYITSQLKPEDISPNMLSLVRIAIIAHEHAFIFGRNSSKERFLCIIENAWNNASAMTPIVDEQEQQSEVVSRNALLLSLQEADAATRYHALHFPLVTKEAFLHYIDEAWEAGLRQRKVYRMEIEGSVNNEYGVALNFACNIALSGKNKGLLPEAYKSTAKGDEGTQDGSKPDTSPSTSQQ